MFLCREEEKGLIVKGPYRNQMSVTPHEKLSIDQIMSEYQLGCEVWQFISSACVNIIPKTRGLLFFQTEFS